ncbi:3-methyladenine DNA glycosylase AlkD [Lentzea atacamensis]|uniref:3-methyladenine DNA glycosylase AlkD n=1 Tax=Lentzea atacamensis TaxID=531938 RepID=A0A316I3L4_9PSEU|nr:DNA alkylation repair protein [Lentzea atacamensis]PWK81903.1 3-methyladenine DNA glycosylase AlkD [Lentzea atacamensis]RAS61072.1 3-methyladenine DNA glycosylase AlkD [Lentzea atacamensis]
MRPTISTPYSFCLYRSGVDSFVEAVRTGLRELADPVKAPEMQAYMKSEMPFLGVQKPGRVALLKSLPRIDSRDEWLDAVRTLWREATYREERYVALALSGDRRFQSVELLPWFDEMIVTGAWWDYVDEIASKRIGPLLRSSPDVVRPLMLKWSVDADRWRRRTSIICQLGFKGATDVELLTACVDANVEDPDFFLRKGIGWALREFAKTEPGWVRAFVEARPGLSPLSRREALKHL